MMPAFRLPKPALAALLVVVAWVSPAAAVTVDRVVSPGGIEAWLVRDHANPIISLRFAFRGGAALDPDGKEGLAEMTSALLDEGAGDLDSQAFQMRLEELAAEIGFDAGLDTFGGSLKTLTENRDAVFDLLRLALTAPRFDADAVERIRGQIQARLRNQAEDDGYIASRTMMRTLLPDHPYGRPSDGTPETVAAITRDDLQGFVGRRLARDNLVVGVVGDIAPDDLGRLLDATFGGLPAAAAPWALPAAAPQGGGATVVVEKPMPQSAIVFAQPGIARSDPDFYAAYVLNHILGGGGFTSRLYAEVREKRGLAYSVWTGLVPRDAVNLIWGGAGTANARVAETLEVVRDEWTRMQAEGVTADELDDAKTYLTGSFPLRFSSSPRIAGILVGMQLDDLGIDYLDKRNGYIDAVTLDAVNRVARDLLTPDKLTVVVVGEPEGVTAE